MEVTTWPEALRWKSPPWGGPATMRATTRVNAEQASKRMIREPTRRECGEGWHWPGSERGKHRLVSLGYWRRHTWKMGMAAPAGLKLAVNERKPRCLRCPEEPFEFPGYRIGRIHRPTGKGFYIGTRPGKASVQSICRRINEMTAPRHGLLASEVVVERLNRTITGWANYFSLGHVSPACQKHKVKSGRFVRFPEQKLRDAYGLIDLTRQTMGLPRAKA